LVIIKSEHQKIFGGFTDVPWESSGSQKKGNGNSFIYSLREDLRFVKLKCLDKNKEIYHSSVQISNFGDNGNYILISDKCD
jgi:hypothetical protein